MTELVSATGEETDRRQRDAAGIGRGALVIGGLTALARIFGLVRTLVFSQTVGATCLGSAYSTANQVPNLVNELVVGGVLASAMVPVLARSAELSETDPAEKARVGLIFSALLTWTILLLLPFAVVIAVSAGPIASVLNPANASAACPHADVVAVTANMLRVFAPQIVLYGLSVVFFGLLQAYRRFAGYALAPLVYSLVLIAAYLAFAPIGKGLPLAKLSGSAQLVLSLGTTLGVAALVVVAAVPTSRLRLRLRPTLRLPPGVARRAGGLAMVGLVEVVASDLSAVVVIALANGRGTTGALVIFNYASQVFNTLNAVFAVAVFVSAFPVLSARDGAQFDATCAGSTRAVTWVACLGMAAMVAVAVPAAHVLAKQADQKSQLVTAFILFAPGLLGTAVIANLSRAMLAIGRLRVAATAVAGSWLLVMAAQAVLAEIVPADLVVGALGLGYSVGQIAAAIPLVIITRRIRGGAAIQGVGRATVAGLIAASVGAAVGLAIAVELPASHKLLDAGVGVLAASAAIVAFGLVAFLTDDGDLRAIAGKVFGMLKMRWSRAGTS